MSRSPQLGGDQVRHDGWRPGDVEASNALLHSLITNGDALMLAQVLEPGLDDERFDITPLLPIGLTPKDTARGRASDQEAWTPTP